jgi:hypothetical protein
MVFNIAMTAQNVGMINIARIFVLQSNQTAFAATDAQSFPLFGG